MFRRGLVALALPLAFLTACSAPEESQVQPPVTSPRPAPPSDEPELGNLGKLEPVVLVNVVEQPVLSTVPILLGDKASASSAFSVSRAQDRLLKAWDSLSEEAGVVAVAAVSTACLPPLRVTAELGSGVPVIFKVKPNPDNATVRCVAPTTTYALVAFTP